MAADPKDDDTHYIGISDDVYLAVCKETGRVLGPTAEGTLGIVFHGLPESDLYSSAPRTEKAVKVPRLLQSDQLLNFHVAEIGFHEGNQANVFASSPGLLGATSFFRLAYARPNAPIPGNGKKPCHIGFFLSPTEKYEVCLLAEDDAWPARFKEQIGDGEEIRALFDEVSKQCAEAPSGVGLRSQLFNNLLFLPYRRPERRRRSHASLKVLGRLELAETHMRRDVDGWWFNLPVAVYPWMSINLERILNSLVDGIRRSVPEPESPHERRSPQELMDETHFGDETVTALPMREVMRQKTHVDEEHDSLQAIKDWDVYQWLRLATQLAEGMKSLHERAAIHGDTRPANIMTGARAAREMSPSSFHWIDIGLGYGAATGYQGNRDETAITPPPLGGGRTTPFYAPERIEVTEYEDADTVTFQPSDEKIGTLAFGWRRRTNAEPVTIRLRKRSMAVRELGKLQKGDRVQVREFLFEVDKVGHRTIEVTNVYEIFLDRVLIQVPTNDLQRVYDHLDRASISRYRIFKHWSQATDIHGLGVIILYSFFMRGLMLEKLETARRARDEREADIDLLYSRPNREAAFEDMISLLRNEGILINMMEQLAVLSLKRDGTLVQRFRSVDDLFQERLMSRIERGRDMLKVVQVLTDVDSNFRYIWRGLDGNYGRFVQLVFGIAMCCLWRHDEVSEVMERYIMTNEKAIPFDFQPFCESRIRIYRPETAAGPAVKVWERLDLIAQTVGPKNKAEARGSKNDDELGRGPTSRDFIRTLKELKKQKEGLERELEEQKKALEKQRAEQEEKFDDKLQLSRQQRDLLEEQLESAVGLIQLSVRDAGSRLRDLKKMSTGKLGWIKNQNEVQDQLDVLAQNIEECTRLCREATERIKMSRKV